MVQELSGSTDFPRQPAHCLAQVGREAPITNLNVCPSPCTHAGTPTPSILWWKDAVEVLDAVPGAELLDGGSLFIHALQPSHSGDYTCLAANDVGSVSSTTTLVVHGMARGKGAPAPCEMLLGRVLLLVPKWGELCGLWGWAAGQSCCVGSVCSLGSVVDHGLGAEKRGNQMPSCLVTSSRLSPPPSPPGDDGQWLGERVGGGWPAPGAALQRLRHPRPLRHLAQGRAAGEPLGEGVVALCPMVGVLLAPPDTPFPPSLPAGG